MIFKRRSTATVPLYIYAENGPIQLIEASINIYKDGILFKSDITITASGQTNLHYFVENFDDYTEGLYNIQFATELENVYLAPKSFQITKAEDEFGVEDLFITRVNGVYTRRI